MAKNTQQDPPKRYPLLRGYLVKQDTGGTRGWSKRWYQNSYENPTVLECFSNEKATKASSKIDFREVTDLRIVRTKGADDTSKKRYGFQFKVKKTTMKWLTEGEAEGEYWREGLNMLYRITHNLGDAGVEAKPDNTVNEFGLYPGEDFGTSVVDFRSSDPGVLSFKKNEMMIIIGHTENGWLPVEFDGKRGWVPAEFIRPLDTKPAKA